MRKDWTETTLGEIAEVNMGQSPPGDTYNTEGIGMPFMQGSAEFGEHYPEPVKFCSAPAKIAEIGDLLLSVRAPVGDSNFANQRIAIGRGLATVRARTGADTHFLRLVIQLNTAGLLATSGTGMFSSITGKNLREFGVNLPPLLEQKRIVDVVSSVDVYIDALQHQAETARSARKAVLHELLSAGGDDWTETTLGDVVTINPEAAKNLAQDDEIVYVDLSSVSADSGISSDLYRGNFGDAPGRARRVIRAYDVLVSTVRPYLRGFALVPEYLDGAIASTGFTVLRANPKSVLSGFVWAVIGMNSFIEYLMDRATGSSYPAVRPDDVASFKFRVPPLDEQKRIVEIVSSMDDVIQSTEQAVTDAKNLRSGLLSDLLSGEHEIPASYDSLLGAA